MIYLHLFLAFMKIGLFGFGGGLAIIQLIYDSIQQFAKITPDLFAEIVAIAQVTPGPVAINTATFVGFMSAGVLGAAVATTGVAVPSFVIISMVSRVMEKFKNSRIIKGALSGIRPAAVGLIASAFLTVSKPVVFNDAHLGSNFHELTAMLPQSVDVVSIALAAVTMVLLIFSKKDPIKILVVMAIVGAVLGA
ncbi:MAG: chromate transporter [Mobilibacterium timonense]|uniref:chromate transporter n=1 Tax=Mobilibacterium timonense TaxID=1871012 RepID=UPI000986CCA0|nr:chromate transporter [Mobilibacterium timonense]MBM6990038.1 chromate transporter [Mobilibacterium timonense]